MQPLPRFHHHHHLTTQKHDASLLVPSVVDLQAPKGSLPAAFAGARSSLERSVPKGQGQGAKGLSGRQAHPIIMQVF